MRNLQQRVLRGESIDWLGEMFTRAGATCALGLEHEVSLTLECASLYWRSMRRLATLLLLPVACAAPSSTHLFGPAATDLPRTPLAIVFIPSQVAQGQDAAFTVTLPPAAYPGGIPLIFTFSGEASGVDTLTLPTDSSGQPLQGDIQVPADAPDGVLSVAIALPTTGQTATTTLTIKDTQAPQLTVSGLTAGVAGFDARHLLLAGTTDTIVVSATDNHALARVGWSINAPVSLGDSVPVSGIASTVNLPIPVPHRSPAIHCRSAYSRPIAMAMS